MPIDVDRVVGRELPGDRYSWGPDDVIRYHLGIGAGYPDGPAGDLPWLYEPQLRVLPSFGVLPVFPTLAGVLALDGVSVNPLLILHGEQEIVVHRPLPDRAEVTNTGRVTGVFDKGKGALIVAETDTVDESGDLLCTNRFGIFARGEGGFGGPSGPAPTVGSPSRPPDVVHESPTLPQQAALYRLCGDKNPLHIDPALAAMAGYDRPILHGLCSYGIALKAVVDRVLDGDPGRVRGWGARFSGVLFPGETVSTSMWVEPGRVLVTAACRERGTPVISHGVVTLADAEA